LQTDNIFMRFALNQKRFFCPNQPFCVLFFFMYNIEALYNAPATIDADLEFGHDI